MSISPSGQTAEGKGVEPSSHVSGNRFSKAARQAISAYLPFERVDPPGIEPGSSVCRTDVFPLDDEPMNQPHHSCSGPQESRTPHGLPAEQPRTPVACGPYVGNRGVEPRTSSPQTRPGHRAGRSRICHPLWSSQVCHDRRRISRGPTRGR